MTLGPEVVVCPQQGFTAFSTYGTSPESPHRGRLAWTHFPEPTPGKGKTNPGELWIAGRDAAQPIKLTDLQDIDAHNGARADWVDEDVLLYFDDGQAKVRRADGTLLHAKPGLPGERTWGNLVLVFQPDLTDPTDGLYVLDVRSGEYTQVLSRRRLLALQSGRLTHPRFSPGGRYIGFCLGEDFYSMETRPGAQPQRLGLAPMHWLWYDEETIAGHTSSWGLGKRYSLDGGVIETLSGMGNHMGVSPEGGWIASETDYGSVPVVLTLFQCGSTQGTEVFRSPYAEAAWEVVCHVNPAFARDSSRIYYNKPTGPRMVQACYRDILSV
ncbi:MAG: hypothetical protein ACLFV7_15180 [Phycisphaerae bacterium]